MSESQGLLRFAKMTGKVAAPENDAAKSFRPPQNGALRNRRGFRLENCTPWWSDTY